MNNKKNAFWQLHRISFDVQSYPPPPPGKIFSTKVLPQPLRASRPVGAALILSKRAGTLSSSNGSVPVASANRMILRPAWGGEGGGWWCQIVITSYPDGNCTVLNHSPDLPEVVGSHIHMRAGGLWGVFKGAQSTPPLAQIPTPPFPGGGGGGVFFWKI